jgi:hypothetical protein
MSDEQINAIKFTQGKLRKFRVEVMNHEGDPLCVYLEVPAHNKSEAIALVKSKLQFTSEVSNG